MQGDTLIIDGDSIPYVLAWNHRDHTDVAVMRKEVRSWMRQLLAATGAQKYLGVLANTTGKCFRYFTYHYKPYKAGRPPKEEYMVFWEPIIRKFLIEDFKFVYAADGMETDDVVAAVFEGDDQFVMCSPDKDLKQIAGMHYNYKDMGIDGKTPNQLITKEQAEYIFQLQMLTGDNTDNINGITGMGEKKGQKLLDETNPIMRNVAVKMAYQNAYGPYYGPIIYKETYLAIRMMTPTNEYWGNTVWVPATPLSAIKQEHEAAKFFKLSFDIDSYKKQVVQTPSFYEETPFH